MPLQPAENGPVLSPGTCISCGSGDFEKKWFDLQITAPRVGRLYLCEDCLVEVRDVLLDRENPAVVRIEQLERANAAGNAAIAFLSDLSDRLGALDLFTAPDDSEAGEGTSESEEPVAKQGSK
jgi:hypothetical protein